MSATKYDVFISHASEDKSNFVHPLAETLRSFGVDVWYDKFTLSIGDSLSRSIDKGLSKSRFGIVVLSRTFIQKGWPEYELRGLLAKEINFKKVILPIWHDISFEEILEYSPSLADKIAIKSSDLSITKIAISIIDLIRPDLFEKIRRRAAFLAQSGKGKIEKVDPKTIKQGPIRHEELPFNLISRIRLIRASLLGAYTLSMRDWIEGFQRDAHPSREIRIWEHLAACLQEFITVSEAPSNEQYEAAFKILLAFSCGVEMEDIDQIQKISKSDLEKLVKIWTHQYPCFDVADKGIDEDYSATAADLERLQKIDKESFPYDIPDELVFELLNQKPIAEN